jgi:hypothetical protein
LVRLSLIVLLHHPYKPLIVENGQQIIDVFWQFRGPGSA